MNIQSLLFSCFILLHKSMLFVQIVEEKDSF